MTRDSLAVIIGRFRAYVDGFRQTDGSLQELLQLKLTHTEEVVRNASLIMAGEGWPEGDRAAGEACAWLHDVGRFSQLQEFGTFQDSKSIDHAVRSVEVVSRENWLSDCDEGVRKRVLTAVAAHNKRDVGASLDEATARLCHLVRDADKLDIFRVLEQAVADGSLERNPEIAWELQIRGAPSPEVVDAVSRGRPVSYAWIKSLSDFVLIQVGWLNGGFRYRTSLRLARERRSLEFREVYLKTLSDDPGVGVCCEAARAFLRRQLEGGVA